MNRFLMQAALGIPMTVYGTGGQTRAFIHVTDTARCLEAAVNNPPLPGATVEIFNQVRTNKNRLLRLINSKHIYTLVLSQYYCCSC
jgi:nucleoside-diphosphate-sugar epimerase